MYSVPIYIYSYLYLLIVNMEQKTPGKFSFFDNVKTFVLSVLLEVHNMYNR